MRMAAAPPPLSSSSMFLDIFHQTFSHSLDSGPEKQREVAAQRPLDMQDSSDSSRRQFLEGAKEKVC